MGVERAGTSLRDSFESLLSSSGAECEAIGVHLLRDYGFSCELIPSPMHSDR